MSRQVQVYMHALWPKNVTGYSTDEDGSDHGEISWHPFYVYLCVYGHSLQEHDQIVHHLV